jgi:hypothetical protein
MSEETTYVVVSRRKAGDADYTSAVVCATEEEANVILDEVSALSGDHSIVTRDEFDSAAADTTQKDV